MTDGETQKQNAIVRVYKGKMRKRVYVCEMVKKERER